MISREEAKKNMCVKFSDYASEKGILEALLDNDAVELEKWRNLKRRVDAYNSKVMADVDSASDEEFRSMVGGWQMPEFKPE